MASTSRLNSMRLVAKHFSRPAASPARFVTLSAVPAQRGLPQQRTVSTPITAKASFHASAKKSILPPLPERINGGPNEPVAIIPPNPVHGSYHWAFERLVSIGLIPITLAPFAAGSLHPLMDGLLCGMILLHSHIGFQSIIIDYVPTWRMPFIRKLFWWGLRLATISVGVGLYEFETHDIGLTEMVKRAWLA